MQVCLAVWEAVPDADKRLALGYKGKRFASLLLESSGVPLKKINDEAAAPFFFFLHL